MGFRIAARTILHLGSELISSDGIAFYELVKNSLDAESPAIRIDVVSRLVFRTYDEIVRALGVFRDVPGWTASEPADDKDDDKRKWRELRDLALDGLVEGAPDVDELRKELVGARSEADFVKAIRESNYIEFDDDGVGMSMDELRTVYLTIGTGHRQQQKADSAHTRRRGAQSVILGEKGLGRLSAMRLGDVMLVITAQRREKYWNQLEIDWNIFAQAADEDLESVDVSPERGTRKEPNSQGTRIRISALRAEWSQEKLEQLAASDFARLVDPFDRSMKLPLELKYNSTTVPVPEFASFLLEHAHGVFKAEYSISRNGEPALTGRKDYRLRRRHAQLRLSGLDLQTLTGTDRDVLQRVGPFSLELYWFNRRVLTKIEGIGNLATVRRLLAMWAGGVALYRDGYRVNPYGGANDDWLDLDHDAFSTSGFKLNRGQIVGRARITQTDNPYLVDQTNREGLKDGPEKRAFVALLSAAVEQYRLYVVEIDDDDRRARRVTAAEALDRFRAESDRLGELLPRLARILESSSAGRAISKGILDAIDELREAAKHLEIASAAHDQERSRIIHLASIGLMIEVLAHELYRATANGLKTLGQARTLRDGPSLSTSLRVLYAQLRTLQRRLKVLDPLSTNARQTKEEFDVVEWVNDIVEGFATRNRGSRVTVRATVSPRGGSWQVRGVKGMFVQVLENLLSNSMYWIAQKHRYEVRAGRANDDDEVIGTIDVALRPRASQILITDNGPGIPEDRRELVFQPFFSTKRNKEGRGLGLYIAREIAEYHGGTLSLGEPDEDGQIHTIIFEIGAADE